MGAEGCIEALMLVLPRREVDLGLASFRTDNLRSYFSPASLHDRWLAGLVGGVLGWGTGGTPQMIVSTLLPLRDVNALPRLGIHLPFICETPSGLRLQQNTARDLHALRDADCHVGPNRHLAVCI